MFTFFVQHGTTAQSRKKDNVADRNYYKRTPTLSEAVSAEPLLYALAEKPNTMC